MFCRNCGRELSENAKFCDGCGTAQAASSVLNKKPVTEMTGGKAQMPINEAEKVITKETVKTMSVARPIAKRPIVSAGAVNRKSNGDILRTIAAALCCVFIFMFLLSGAGVLTAREAVSPGNIKDTFDAIDSTLMEDVVEDNGIVEAADPDNNDALIETIVLESTIPDFVEKKMCEYGKYILGGSNPGRIENEEVVKLLVDNENVADYLFSAYNKPYLELRCKRYVKQQIEPHLKDFYFYTSLETARVFLSLWFIVAFAVLTALLIILLIKIKKCKASVLNWLGYTFIAAGGVYLLTFVTRPLITVLLDIKTSTKGVINALFGCLWTEVLLIGGVILVTGVLMVFARKIISRIADKKEKA